MSNSTAPSASASLVSSALTVRPVRSQRESHDGTDIHAGTGQLLGRTPHIVRIDAHRQKPEPSGLGTQLLNVLRVATDFRIV